MVVVIKEKITRGLREIGLLGFTVLALFFVIALITYNQEDAGWSHRGTTAVTSNACGVFGAWIADFLLSIFGLMAYLCPIMIFWHGYLLFFQHEIRAATWIIGLRWFGFVITLLSGSALLSLHLLRTRISLPNNAGGHVGQEVGDGLLILLGDSGATLSLLAPLLGGITLLTGLSWLHVIDSVGKYTLKICRYIYQQCALYYLDGQKKRHIEAGKPTLKRQDPIVNITTNSDPVAKAKSFKQVKIDPAFTQIEKSNREDENQQMSLVPATKGKLPSLMLLDERINTAQGFSQAVLQEMSGMVEAVLQDFNVEVKVVAVNPGPVVTRFELQLAPGIKVSKVSGLSKDMARAISVSSVRIVEVIPGKTVIGLEIPNKEREMVSLRELLASHHFKKSKSPLSLALGKDISGLPVIADLDKMPHVLVAGTTGSGKSVAINTMILSLLYKSTPAQVRLIMVDPKMLELSIYEGIPQLLTPVITDMKEASNALRWCVAEMERRYKLMSKMGVRNLAGFNKLIKVAEVQGKPIRDPLFEVNESLAEVEEWPLLTTLPSIVIVIDELADMMMIVGKKVEALIARLAQKARAAGLHLILATQRPSVDVLTGLIKANVPTRISFQVPSKIDSRTILDQAGAESLLGNGDMLYMPSGTSIPIRAHGAFVDDHEVHKIVDFLKKTGKTAYLDLVIEDNGDGLEGGEFK